MTSLQIFNNFLFCEAIFELGSKKKEIATNIFINYLERYHLLTPENFSSNSKTELTIKKSLQNIENNSVFYELFLSKHIKNKIKQIASNPDLKAKYIIFDIRNINIKIYLETIGIFIAENSQVKNELEKKYNIKPYYYTHNFAMIFQLFICYQIVWQNKNPDDKLQLTFDYIELDNNEISELVKSFPLWLSCNSKLETAKEKKLKTIILSISELVLLLNIEVAHMLVKPPARCFVSKEYLELFYKKPIKRYYYFCSVFNESLDDAQYFKRLKKTEYIYRDYDEPYHYLDNITSKIGGDPFDNASFIVDNIIGCADKYYDIHRIKFNNFLYEVSRNDIKELATCLRAYIICTGEIKILYDYKWLAQELFPKMITNLDIRKIVINPDDERYID